MRTKTVAATAVALAMLAAGCYRDNGAASTPAPGGAPRHDLVTLTPAGAGEVDSVTWALYRGTTSIDPITAGDYPEITVTSLMCESLFRQSPDGSVEPGLATRLDFPDPKTAVLTLRDGVKFWDGSPMTAEDVAFSIERNRDPKGGGYWVPVLDRVTSVEPTGPRQVTLRLKQPDYWLRDVLSYMPGMVVSKRYVQAKGKDYGTVKGGAMCTGSFKLGQWRTGDVLSVVRNDGYWNRAESPLVRRIDFKGIPDEATLTAALLTGEVDGAYLELPLSTMEQIRASGTVKVYHGPSYLIDALIVADMGRGPLADPRVRRALSLAIDRESYIATLYKGSAQPARALGTPGTWGAERQVFQAAWDALPAPRVDLDSARKLVQEAGASGKTVRFGMSNELNKLATEANLVKSAAEKIGLKAELKAVSTDAYSGFFLDPKARADVDGFFTTNYPNWADPGALYATLSVPGGPQDYGRYRNPEAASLLQRARGSAGARQRAEATVAAQAIVTKDLPWIPIAAPDTVLVLNAKLTGATVSSQHLFAPWASKLGAVG
ncbi:ABC transporter substrate-binding protein [Nonomuraea aurantiaca]|uniref:ABC transporter substrate-binding protein n=1 Tax=Nonomuraea aurantiaca TaxID=2878562 RepID=UPI001CD99C26|nr:ABC transporter substrate-binding protein [Nonomuraea aurantiaca]MCA2223671.1 ABC transporter substrate-binding protein [Nonomuraea aurantiaca]